MYKHRFLIGFTYTFSSGRARARIKCTFGQIENAMQPHTQFNNNITQYIPIIRRFLWPCPAQLRPDFGGAHRTFRRPIPSGVSDALQRRCARIKHTKDRKHGSDGQFTGEGASRRSLGRATTRVYVGLMEFNECESETRRQCRAVVITQALNAICSTFHVYRM